MAMKIGILMLVGLFIAVFLLTVREFGWAAATAGFFVPISVFAYIVFAVYLITKSEWGKKAKRG